jgi:hypothetical protein
MGNVAGNEGINLEVKSVENKWNCKLVNTIKREMVM